LPVAGAPDKHCEPCAEALLYKRLGEPLDDFLDQLPTPVLVIGADHCVRTANHRAVKLLGKAVARFRGSRIGETLECIHASEPAGCGETVHCKTCAIRRSVEETQATGEKLSGVPAYSDIYADGGGIKEVCFEISTELVGDVVLLRIHDLREEAGG